MREVAVRVGVNIATLDYYFSTKEELVQEVVKYLLHQFFIVTSPLPADYEDTPVAQLKQVFVDFQYRLEHEPDTFLVMNELHLAYKIAPYRRKAMEK